MTMGELIRQRRKQLRLTAAQLAKLVRCSKSYISKLETGQRRPSLPTLIKLCAALACSTIDLIAEETQNETAANRERN